MRSQTPLNRLEAIWMMDATLRLAGVVMINESTKFVFAMPPAKTNNVPHLDPKRVLPPKASSQIFPPGLLKFNDADVWQVLTVYAELAGRKVASAKLPSKKIAIRSQTPLDYGEALYALEAIAAINDVPFDLSDPEKVSLASPSGISR